MGFYFTIEYEYEVSPGKFEKIQQEVDIPIENFKELITGPFFLSKGDKIKVPLPEGATLYTVKSGDNVYALSKKFNVSEQEILDANNFANDRLQVGQQIIIPAPNRSFRTFSVHQVRSNQTLEQIARLYQTDLNALSKVNQLEHSKLRDGAHLIIPNKKTMRNNQEYTVQSGDTLWTIAKKYNTTVNELKQINNLSSNNLSIGQKLVIPVKNDTTTYTIKSGDSLWSIAQKFDTTTDAILKLNDLNPNNLKVGTEIIIPVVSNTPTQPSKPADTNSPTTSTSTTNVGTYTVRENDTLESISKQFNTTPEELIRLNALTATVQIFKDILFELEGRRINYRTETEITLRQLAKKFDVPEDMLFMANPSIKPDEVLPIGTSLKIPILA